MKKQKIITRICTFTLATSLIAANASYAFAATSKEPAMEEQQSPEEDFEDGITPPR